jgi:hypothetical protein
MRYTVGFGRETPVDLDDIHGGNLTTVIYGDHSIAHRAIHVKHFATLIWDIPNGTAGGLMLSDTSSDNFNNSEVCSVRAIVV